MPVKLVKMVAKKSLRYGTRMMQAGEEFDAHGETDARLYAALGYADRRMAAPVVAPPPPVVEAVEVPRVAYKRAAKKTTSRWGSLMHEPAPEASPDEPSNTVEPSAD
jgi:hypothetical protein